MIIAGGGTGGHFFPGLAVAQALRAGAPSASVLFAGTARGIEARLAPRYGFPFTALPGSGVAGVGILQRLRGLVAVPLAMVRSLLLLDRFRPHAVVGVGGYASFPVALASGLLGVPVLLLEQNVTPGLANRVLSIWAVVVATAFPQTLRHFRGKGRLLGNPVRASLAAVPGEAPPERPFRLLVFGGSRGARAINDAVVAALPELAAFPGGMEIRHQTGTEDLDRVQRRLRGRRRARPRGALHRRHGRSLRLVPRGPLPRWRHDPRRARRRPAARPPRPLPPGRG